MLFIKFGYVAAIVGAILLTIALNMVQVINIPLYISLPVALALLLIPAYYHLKRNMVRYTLTDSKIEIDYGLIARTTRNIPLAKIQDVTVSASILQRFARFWECRGGQCQRDRRRTTTLSNINHPREYADLIFARRSGAGSKLSALFEYRYSWKHLRGRWVLSKGMSLSYFTNFARTNTCSGF